MSIWYVCIIVYDFLYIKKFWIMYCRHPFYNCQVKKKKEIRIIKKGFMVTFPNVNVLSMS